MKILSTRKEQKFFHFCGKFFFCTYKIFDRSYSKESNENSEFYFDLFFEFESFLKDFADFFWNTFLLDF